MRPVSSRRVPSDTPDAAGLIVALLVRYPELATIVSHPSDGTLTLSFAIRAALDRDAARGARDAVAEHVRSLLEFRREAADVLQVGTESDRAMSFVRLVRDARTFGREELELLVALLAQHFGERVVKSPPPENEAGEEEASDDLVEYALDALRDPQSKRSLVGFREEKRVLVYFVPSPKKAKARARN